MELIGGRDHHTAGREQEWDEQSSRQVEDGQSAKVPVPPLRQHRVRQQKRHVDADRCGRSSNHHLLLVRHDELFPVICKGPRPGECLCKRRRGLGQQVEVRNKAGENAAPIEPL